MSIFSAIHIIAERRIEEAIKDGKLDHPDWHNRPLPKEDPAMVPDDLKMAYKILKNSGFLPPEIEARKEINRLEELIASTEDEHARLKQIRKHVRLCSTSPLFIPVAVGSPAMQASSLLEMLSIQ